MAIIISVATALILLRKKGIEANLTSGNKYNIKYGSAGYIVTGLDLKNLAVELQAHPYLTVADIEDYLRKHSL